MKNLKVSLKLIVSFLIVIVMAIIVGSVGIFGMYSITTADTELYEINTVAVSAMGEIRETLQRQRVMNRNTVLHAGNEAKFQETAATMNELEAKMLEQMAIYEATITDPAEEDAYYNAKKLYLEDYARIKNEINEASKVSFEAALAAQEDPDVTTTVSAMVDGFSVAMENNNVWAEEKSSDNDALFLQMTFVEIGVLAMAIIVAMFFAIYISGLISKPLARMRDLLSKMGTVGDLALSEEEKRSIEADSSVKDEIGQCVDSCAKFTYHLLDVGDSLGQIAGGDLTVSVDKLSDRDTIGNALTTMLENLNKMFAEINSSSNQVSTGSVQIADGAQLLAQGATEQSATVEELSASITQIAAQTKQNAGTANEAQTLGETIKQSAEQGSQQMEQMMQAVEEINESSKSISKVIKIIDDIAFQTNILALNAAVEAARAGQHGKGFAVVADEVRSLAAKSAEAAKNTNELIESSIQKAEQGASISQETSESLKKIVEGILRSSELISEIARSSAEQSTAISQVSDGIDQVSQVVQQNSATAEQSAAASEEMSGQATLLQQLIAQFKIKGNTPTFGGMTPKAAPSPSAVHAPSSASTGYAISGSDKY